MSIIFIVIIIVYIYIHMDAYFFFGEGGGGGVGARGTLWGLGRVWLRNRRGEEKRFSLTSLTTPHRGWEAWS